MQSQTSGGTVGLRSLGVGLPFKSPLLQSEAVSTPAFWGQVVLVLVGSGKGEELGSSLGNASVGHGSQTAHEMNCGLGDQLSPRVVAETQYLS